MTSNEPYEAAVEKNKNLDEKEKTQLKRLDFSETFEDKNSESFYGAMINKISSIG